MENTQRVKIKADVMWAYMEKPNEMSGKYQVDLCNLSDAAVTALEEMGVTPRQKEEKGFFITCKSTNPIRAFDKDGDVIQGISIGNGSKSVALIGAYEWKFKNKEGVSPSLKKLVIDELVAFEGVGDPETIMDDDDVL
tara:strand:- start:939 stop:1352 length:414 start_codon:yes stop_codon:yes gene_type:complete